MPTLKLEYESNKRPVVCLKINGTDYRFLLDTGATHSIIQPHMIPVLAHSNHKTPIGLYGVGGEVECYALHVQFNFVKKSIPRIVVSNRGVALAAQTVGLIGQDILQQFSSITFDNIRRTVTFNL